jgi:hypothetical protein
MRIGIVVSLAFAALVLPRFGIAQDAEVEPDGGVAAEDDTPAVPAAEGETAAPAGSVVPSTASPALAADDWNFQYPAGKTPPERREPARQSRRAPALSFIPFLAAGVFSAVIVTGSAALARTDFCVQGCDEDDSPEAQQEKEDEDDEKAHAAARKTTTIVITITGLIATPFHAYMLNSGFRRYRGDAAVAGGALLGALLGLGLDVGLACTLYFTTEHWASVVVPSFVGLVALPTIGGATGAHIVRRSWSKGRISLGPPLPIALVTSAGRAVPGFALGGVLFRRRYEDPLGVRFDLPRPRARRVLVGRARAEGDRGARR